MENSNLVVEPLDLSFGARVHGIKLAKISDPDFTDLYQIWLQYGLLIFTDQWLTRTEQIKFAKRFGALEFEIAALSNVLEDGTLRPDNDTDEVIQVLKGNMGWHHDSTHMPVQAKGAVFSAEEVPSSGGATGFADMRAAYHALDDQLRQKIENLRAHHSLYHSQQKVGHEGTRGSHQGGFDAQKEDTYAGYGFHDGPVSVRPLVKTHPETGEKNLLIGRHAYNVIGMSSAESEKLLQQLVDFSCQHPRIYHHEWKPGETVVWDNRRLMHQATPWPMNERRIMWHSRIAGNSQSELALTK